MVIPNYPELKIAQASATSASIELFAEPGHSPKTVTGIAENLETLARQMQQEILNRDMAHLAITCEDMIKYAEKVKAWAEDRMPGGSRY